MKYADYYTDEIIKYATDYLNNRYGSSDSVTNRRSYIPIIAHIMSNYKISYMKIDANWPKFYLSDIMPIVVTRLCDRLEEWKWLQEWKGLQKFATFQLDQHIKSLIEIIADKTLADVIYDIYLKHLSVKD